MVQSTGGSPYGGDVPNCQQIYESNTVKLSGAFPVKVSVEDCKGNGIERVFGANQGGLEPPAGATKPFQGTVPSGGFGFPEGFKPPEGFVPPQNFVGPPPPPQTSTAQDGNISPPPPSDQPPATSNQEPVPPPPPASAPQSRLTLPNLIATILGAFIDLFRQR